MASGIKHADTGIRLEKPEMEGDALHVITANLDVATHKIVNLVDPTEAQDAVTKHTLDALITRALADVYNVAPADKNLLAWNNAQNRYEPRLLLASDIPNLPAAKITSGVLAPARVGPKIQDADGDTYLWVEKTANEDKIHGVVKGVEAFLMHDDGILDLVKQSSVGINSDAGQAIPTDTVTQLTYNIVDYDTQGEADLANNQITVTKEGTYLIVNAAQIDNWPADHYLWMQPTGSTHGEITISVLQSAIQANIRVTATGICHLVAGEHVTSLLKQYSGSSQSLSTQASQNYLRVYKLA